MMVLMAIIVSFLLASYFLKIDKMYAMIGYFVAILGYYTFSAFLALKKVKELHFPAEYIKYSLYATYLRLGGLIVFVVLLGFGFAQNLEQSNL